MRLNYLQVGDRVGHDEFNALVHLLLSRNYPINETIHLSPSGFFGNYGIYTLDYDNDSIAYRDDDIQILDNTGYFTVKCRSDLNSQFRLHIGDYTFVSNVEGNIIVNLENFINDEVILNSFLLEVVYKEPYINVKVNPLGNIQTTSDLKEAISTVEEGETLTLSGTIVHNIASPIKINSDITIEGNAIITNSNNVTGNLFVVDDDYSLYLKDLNFNGFSNDENAGVIYNNGVLSLNNCKFNTCTSTGNGGAIYNHYGEVYSDNTEYNSCGAVNGAGIFNAGDE